MSIQFEAQGYTFDTANLPEATLRAFLQGGASHKFGSEIASKVNGAFIAEYLKASPLAEGASEADKAKRASDAKAYAKSKVDSEDYAASAKAFRDEMYKAALEGTLGDGRGASGPKVSPFEAECNAIVKRELLAILRGLGLWSKKSDPTAETEFKFKEGVRTWESLRQGYLGKNEAKVHKEAKAKIEAAERTRARAAEAKAKSGEDGVSADSIGF
jgi:hypothetical protein